MSADIANKQESLREKVEEGLKNVEVSVDQIKTKISELNSLEDLNTLIKEETVKVIDLKETVKEVKEAVCDLSKDLSDIDGHALALKSVKESVEEVSDQALRIANTIKEKSYFFTLKALCFNICPCKRVQKT